MSKDYKKLEAKAAIARKRLLQMIFNAGGGHTGGSLSAVDILITLFFDTLNYHPDDPEWSGRDRFIMSKGHSVEAYYSVLAEAGFFSPEVLETYGKFGSILAGHPTRKVPGIELNSGALGHGLSVGVGMAMAAKMDYAKHKIFVLMGDGEQGEGSIMEAANSAGHYGLDNIVAIIDRNFLQISGNTEEVMQLNNLKERWAAYHWHVEEVNGHDVQAMANLFKSMPKEKGKPHLVIANTIKGRGISFMEKRAEWHHKVPSDEQLKQALGELNNLLMD